MALKVVKTDQKAKIIIDKTKMGGCTNLKCH